MKDKKNNEKRNLKKELQLDEFLAQGRFDEEDEDSVTDDTLEFLSLDDDAIEVYQSENNSTRNSRKVSALRDEEDEEYEDEDYDDEDYDEDDYEDEDDEDYEDEEYNDYEDKRGGLIVRFKRYLTEMSTLDMVVAALGIVVIVGAVLSGTLYVNAKSIEKQVAAFASIGEEIEGISVIGESGLLAVSESAKLSNMISLGDEPEEIQGEEPDADEEKEKEDEKNKTIEVTLNLTSIQSDLKIKFVNKATGKLIGGVPFEVEVSNGKKTFDLKDEDKDGIIYRTEVEAGTYQVTVKPFKENEYEEYKLPASSTSVKVTDTIAYKKVEVADEVKTEAEVNAAVEDTAVQDTVVESTLQNTVEWVESTKTLIDSNDNYEEINKANIPDPATIGAAGNFVKTVAPGVQNGVVALGTVMPLDLESLSPECTCESECASQESAYGTSCTVCQGNFENCKHKQSELTNQEKVAKLHLNTTSLSLEKGKTGTLSVEGNYSGEIKYLAWSSNNDIVASVNGGTVTANGAGTAIISVIVTIGGESLSLSDTCEVTVNESKPAKPTEPTEPAKPTEPTNQQKLEKVSLNKTTISLTQGGTDTLSLTGDYASIASMQCVSGNINIASVDNNGRVTAIGAGTTKITVTATIGDATRMFECTVTVAAQTYKITNIAGSSSVAVGELGGVIVSTEPAGGTVSWTSSDEKIAKIESNDNTSIKYRGVAAGTATITAKCGDSTATWKVTVYKDLKTDSTTKLKDKNGKQIYVYKDGKYVEATYADYYVEGMKFYLSKSMYKYTGWQTIDGSVYFFDKDGNYVTGEQVIQGIKYTFGSDGKMSSGSGTMGIDVSKHNGNIDWNAVKNSGVSFVIIRCGYRGSSTGVLVEDPMFRSNIKGAKAAGLKVGVYFFCQAVNEVEAVEEASMAVSLVSGYGLDMPIFLDVESANGGRGDKISKETRTAVCKAFCQTVQNSGYSAGIYANKTWFNEKINTGSLTSYKIWLAQYASTPTYTTTRYDMWQYSSKGKISGISGDVDLDIRYY